MLALILPGNIWFAPYLHIYTKVLDNLGVEYTIISWNRDGRDIKTGHQFEYRSSSTGGTGVLLPYLKYVSFIKKTIRQEHIDKLIVFGPQLGILLSYYLTKNFKHRYIFDLRDLSIEQKNICKIPFKVMLKYAYSIFISSPGFERCLPNGFKYNISHNFDIDIVNNYIDGANNVNLPVPINVLTIGGIRNFESNVEVVKALGNQKNFKMRFVGKGGAAPMIENFAKENDIKNISFIGYYEKKDEPKYIKDSTFINIYLPWVISHETLLSNRFYCSLIYKKPMIVNKGTVQGDYCEEYDLGVALENCDGLDKKLEEYLNTLDQETYAQRCNTLLKSFIQDYDKFVSIVTDFVK